VGYSPKRVNPGDREHTVEKVIKVVAGDTPETLEPIAEVYGTGDRKHSKGHKHSPYKRVSPYNP